MQRGRRKSAFVAAGSGRPLRGLLKPRLARRLEVAVAWRRAAGEELTRRAPTAILSRGVLSVEVVAATDESWRRTLIELLPGLVGRIAAQYPDWGIRRCRVVSADGNERCSPTMPVVLPCAEDPLVQLSQSLDSPAKPQDQREGKSVQQVMEDYLSRAPKP